MRLGMISWDVRAFMYDILGSSCVYVYLGTFGRLCMISWERRAPAACGGHPSGLSQSRAILTLRLKNSGIRKC